MRSILASFGIDESALLGDGGEACVYALDGERVLRVYRTEAQQVAEQRAALADEMRRETGGKLPFAVPEVLDLGTRDGHTWCIEWRIAGERFSKALEWLRGEERATALRNYLHAADLIQQLRVRRPYFGELIGDEPLRAETWAAFLREKMERTLVVSRGDLLDDVPELDARLHTVFARLDSVAAGVTEGQLVHGDYFPGNVMLAEDLSVTGVIDFSVISVIGDPRMDIAGAIAFLGVVPACDASDEALLLEEAVARHGRGIVDVIEAYRGYYAVYFSFTKHHAMHSPYDWCVEQLRRVPEA